MERKRRMAIGKMGEEEEEEVEEVQGLLVSGNAIGREGKAGRMKEGGGVVVNEKGREQKIKENTEREETGRNGLAKWAADSGDDSVALGHRVGVSLLGPNAVGDVGDSFLEPIWPRAVWAPNGMAHGQRDRERERERGRQTRMPLCLFQAVYANFRNNLFLWGNSLLFSPNGTARFIAGAL
jgi:hypothetical protein